MHKSRSTVHVSTYRKIDSVRVATLKGRFRDPRQPSALVVAGAFTIIVILTSLESL